MTPLILSPRQRSKLEYLGSHNPVAKERCRAQALLWLDEGETPEQVAESLRVSRRTVYYWVEWFHDRDELDLRQRLADAPRPGRPRAAGDGIDPWVAEVIDTDPRQLGYHQTVWAFHYDLRPNAFLKCPPIPMEASAMSVLARCSTES